MKTSNKCLWSIFGIIFAVILVTAIGMRMSSCSASNLFFTKTIKGNGNIAIQGHNLPDFNKVVIGIAGKVVVNKGKAQIVIRYDSNLMPYVNTYVQDGTLYIKTKGNVNIESSVKPVVTITTNNVRAIDAAASNKVIVSNINPEQFRMSVSGSGEGHIAGKTKDLDLDISGLGKIIGNEIRANETRIDISGSGKCLLNGTTKSLHINISGTGKLLGKDFVANKAKVNISGVGKLIMHVVHSLDVDISGLGKIQYYGNPLVTKHTSGTGKVSKIG